MKQVIFCPKETRILIGDIKESDILIAKKGNDPIALIWYGQDGWQYTSKNGSGSNWGNLLEMLSKTMLSKMTIYKVD